jgi:hypothetical protein
LNHYKFADEICVVVHITEQHPFILEEVDSYVSKYPQAKVVATDYGRAFDWNRVTERYNELTATHPDDWWIVADIDEFQVYPQGNPLHIIKECDRNGWEIVRGGFIDRLGGNGDFPELSPTRTISGQYPLMGFFRYPISNACPNKISLMKGKIELTPGQHYAIINGHTTWGWQGWEHPLIAPYQQFSVQVHHFKWTASSIKRMEKIVEVDKDYAFSDEYRKMYDSIKNNDFKIDIDNQEFMFEYSEVTDFGYDEYHQWNKLIKKIVTI